MATSSPAQGTHHSADDEGSQGRARSDPDYVDTTAAGTHSGVRNEVDAVWEERAEIRDEIQNLIAPFGRYKQPQQVPPFTGPELIVMAILCSPKRGLTISDIQFWLVDVFAHYRDQAVEQYILVTQGVQYHDGDDPLFKMVRNALDCWEMPISFHQAPPFGSETVNSFRTARRKHEVSITVSTGRGRVFLRKWLELERKGTFNFFHLPPELRNMIYEMVLTFPDSGIWPPLTPPDAKLTFESREHEGSRPFNRGQGGILLTEPLEQMLALLSVDRRIFEEAMPTFYNVNGFIFPQPFYLDQFATKVSLDRFQHMRRMAVSLTPQEMYGGHASPTPWMNAVAKIMETRQLRVLEIKMEGDKTGWYNVLPFKSNGRLDLLPGLMHLIIAGGRAERFDVDPDMPCLSRLVKRYIMSRAKRLQEAEAGSSQEDVFEGVDSDEHSSDEESG